MVRNKGTRTVFGNAFPLIKKTSIKITREFSRTRRSREKWPQPFDIVKVQIDIFVQVPFLRTKCPLALASVL